MCRFICDNLSNTANQVSQSIFTTTSSHFSIKTTESKTHWLQTIYMRILRLQQSKYASEAISTHIRYLNDYYSLNQYTSTYTTHVPEMTHGNYVSPPSLSSPHTNHTNYSYECTMNWALNQYIQNNTCSRVECHFPGIIAHKQNNKTEYINKCQTLHCSSKTYAGNHVCDNHKLNSVDTLHVEIHVKDDDIKHNRHINWTIKLHHDNKPNTYIYIYSNCDDETSIAVHVALSVANKIAPLIDSTNEELWRVIYKRVADAAKQQIDKQFAETLNKRLNIVGTS